MNNFKKSINKSIMAVKKYSPEILVTTGVIGLGATAYLAYKSRDKVEAVIEGIEADHEAGIEVNKVDIVVDLSKALAVPCVVGVASVAAILSSYRIQNKRIATLAGALVAQQAHNAFMENKYRKVHGDEEFLKFVATEKEEYDTGKKNKDGSAKMEVKDVKKEVDQSIGQWYDESSEYVSDDHTYNIAMIESIDERLQTILFQRGSLLLNEVREALGFERIRAGALLGWTTLDSFHLDKIVTNIKDENGEAKEQIWVTWTRPRYIYDEVEFTGRYAINAL